MAAAKVKTLAEQKHDLVARGDLYRRAMADDMQQIEASLGWIPKTIYLIKATSPLLVLGSPLIAWLLRGRRKTKIMKNGEPQTSKASILGRVWATIRIAQQAVPFVHGFMQAWPKVKKSPARGSESVHSGDRARE